MYGLHGKIIAAPGMRAALLGYLLENASSMPGCYVYIVSEDTGNPDAIWVYEIWDSPEAHRASLNIESVQQTIAKARPLIVGMGDRVEFTPVGGRGLPDQ
ncbi:MAG: antibiotic biosynthesis monooxygenase [Chloroflexi bacterium]|nr:antibiotic biosynthesis monooxygenase [Chloroflexota bacterium]